MLNYVSRSFLNNTVHVHYLNLSVMVFTNSASAGSVSISPLAELDMVAVSFLSCPA